MELKFNDCYIVKPNKKKLTKKQRQWLVDNGYVDTEVLDSYTSKKGWEKYFIDNFNWVLLGKQQYGMEVLQLIDNGRVDYEVHLILYEDKYQELMSL